jgi:hypothetical protein
MHAWVGVRWQGVGIRDRAPWWGLQRSGRLWPYTVPAVLAPQFAMPWLLALRGAGGLAMRAWMCLAVWAISCKGGVETAGESGSPPTPTDSGATSPVAAGFELAANPTNPLAALATVSLDAPAEVSFAFGADGAPRDRTTPTWAVDAGAHELVVLGLYPAAWEVELLIGGVSTGQVAAVVTEAPRSFRAPAIDARGGTWSDDEAICASFEAPPHYGCVDRQGRPTLWVELPGNAMFVWPAQDGTLVAHPDGPPYLVRFDTAGRELGRLAFDDLTGATYPHGWIDEHDSIEITEGPWTGMWAVLTAVEDAGRIGAGIVVVDPDSGQVMWDWSAHGAPGDGLSVDPERLPYDRWGVSRYGEDWLHANALVHDVDPEGGEHFWMSLRHQDWVIRVDVPGGEIGARLGYGGDFELVDDLGAAEPQPLPNDQWCYHQHAIELARQPDGRLDVLMFDNGNARRDAAGEPSFDPLWSRAVRFRLDEAAGQATVAWSYGDPPPGEHSFFGVAAGDADAMPEGGGALITKAVDGAFMREVSEDGQILWNASVSGEGELYRAEFYPSLYEIAWAKP